MVDYLAGVAVGQVEGQRVAYTTIMIEANKLLEKLPKANPPATGDGKPAPPPRTYPVEDVR